MTPGPRLGSSGAAKATSVETPITGMSSARPIARASRQADADAGE